MGLRGLPGKIGPVGAPGNILIKIKEHSGGFKCHRKMDYLYWRCIA